MSELSGFQQLRVLQITSSTINSLLRCQNCLVFNSWEYYKLPVSPCNWHPPNFDISPWEVSGRFYVSLTFWNIPLHHVSFRLTEIPLHHVATYNPVYKDPRPQPLLSLSGNSTQTRQPSLLWLPVLRPVMLSSSLICGVSYKWAFTKLLYKLLINQS